MSHFKVNIKLNDATLAALYNGQYSLIVFKGASGPPALKSTVWFSQSSLGYTTTISWQMLHRAYISTSTASAGAIIGVVSEKDMNAGQLATVTDDNELIMGPGNMPGFYQICNSTGKPLSAGITNVDANGNSAPICCTTLYGNSTTAIEPIEKIYMCFSNELTQVGTVWEQTTSSGYVIDVTEAYMNGVTVTFDINKGWSCGNPIQRNKCQHVDSGKSFSDFLNRSEAVVLERTAVFAVHSRRVN